MKIAKELANENLKTNAGGPFGACIVKDGKIIDDSNPYDGKNNTKLENKKYAQKRKFTKKNRN